MLCIILSRMKRKTTRPQDAKALQRAFFEAAGPNLALLKEMFDRLPNVASYIKDAEGRFMAINRRNCEQCGFEREDDVIGKRSCDVFPKKIADYIMARDRQVLKTGLPIIDRRELRTAANAADTISINIYPVRNLQGDIIGTACCYHTAELAPSAIPNAEKIGSAVAYLNQHFAENISIQDLPVRVGLSSATFYRVFAQTTNATPNGYLTSLRLNHARRLLETTDKTIADIAQECGFCDHSHFVHAFRRERGQTPGQYRAQHKLILGR